MLSSVAQEDAKHFMRRECSTVMQTLQSPQNLVMLSLSFLTSEEDEKKYNYGYIFILAGSTDMVTKILTVRGQKIQRENIWGVYSFNFMVLVVS